jgi:hypothetical protein
VSGVHLDDDSSRWASPLARCRQKLEQPCFVLEMDGRAVLAFLASDLNQARGLCSENWFITELASYRSYGLPVWDGTAEFTVRIANPAEAAKVQMALDNELVRREYEGHIFAFLLPVDAPSQ